MVEVILRAIYKLLIKPFLFALDPEKVHSRAISLGKRIRGNSKRVVGQFFRYRDRFLTQEIFGLKFQNPVGLSAGFDKDGEILELIEALGFGFEVVGTVTLKPYPGNPPPRLIRIPKEKSIWVNYGLKSQGIDEVLKNVAQSKTKSLIKGISIGRSNVPETADLENGIEDYFLCFKKALDSQLFDFFELNISCPNLLGGVDFSKPENFKLLLEKISSLKIKKPILVKMPITIELEDFEKILKLCVEYRISGVSIGNLKKNFAKDLLPQNISDRSKGGISGKLTFEDSNKLIALAYKKYGKEIKIVGIGGIFSPEDAYLKIKLGASLVALITGLIYEGPQLIKEIKKGLKVLAKKDGFSHISQAVGSYHRV